MSTPTPIKAEKVEEEPPVVIGHIVDPVQDVAICRSCGREFHRNPGVHDGQAQYYRCQNCDHIRPVDIFNMFCIVS